MLLHYCYFAEDFNKKKLILGRFVICQKSALVLDLFCKKGHLKLHYEIKILLLLAIFLLATFWEYLVFNKWLTKDHILLCKGLGYTMYIAGVYFYCIQRHLLRTKNKSEINDTVTVFQKLEPRKSIFYFDYYFLFLERFAFFSWISTWNMHANIAVPFTNTMKLKMML